MTPERQKQLLLRVAEEGRRPHLDVLFPVYLEATSVLAIIGNLQLALRCPGNNGPSAKVARTMIDGMIDQLRQAGLIAHAELAEAGDDPANDFGRCAHCGAEIRSDLEAAHHRCNRKDAAHA